MPLLFPAYFPLPCQRSLLEKIQTILEQACFNFGRQSLPNVLAKNHWDCPESAELNLWIAEFRKRKEIFHKSKDLGKPLERVFRSAADIRHAAVHRVRVSAKGIELFMLDAESLATLLQQPASLTLLVDLRRNTQTAIEELERNKHVLRSKLEETMKSIATQRAQLDLLEQTALSDMLREDDDYQQLAAMNLLQAISPKKAALSATTTEEEAKSEAEGTENAGDEKDYKCSEWPGLE